MITYLEEQGLGRSTDQVLLGQQAPGLGQPRRPHLRCQLGRRGAPAARRRHLIVPGGPQEVGPVPVVPAARRPAGRPGPRPRPRVARAVPVAVPPIPVAAVPCLGPILGPAAVLVPLVPPPIAAVRRSLSAVGRSLAPAAGRAAWGAPFLGPAAVLVPPPIPTVGGPLARGAARGAAGGASRLRAGPAGAEGWGVWKERSKTM